MKNEVYEAMKREAYNTCKNLFQLYVHYWKMSNGETAARDFYRETAEEYRHEYRGACDVYERLFDEEFILTDKDRRKIFPENYEQGYEQEVEEDDNDDYEYVLRG